MQPVTKETLFGQLDFINLSSDADFKEDSVREVIILPLLKQLGYEQQNIVRSKTLEHPFIKIGSKKRFINLVPDYALKVENSFAWVLDAKAPNEKVINTDNVEQVYSYSEHPEIRSTYFALCNGLEFALYRKEVREPILFFPMNEVEHYWNRLNAYLSPGSFQIGKNITYDTTNATAKPAGFDYSNRPLLEEIAVKKQQAKRHFGVHGYFTKQTWNVVAEYIKNYSKPGDLVLDPFGGSGVTAIEAIMLDRKSIHIDINPLSEFIVKSLITPVKLSELSDAFQRVVSSYELQEPKNKEETKKILKKLPYPKDVSLPKNSDVPTVDALFTDEQLAKLALLKSLIRNEESENIKSTLLLMFSGLINKINLTYHASEGRSEGRGNSAMFAYYRYRIAKEPAFIDVLTYFKSRFKKVLEAKKELDIKINHSTINNIQVLKKSATDLKFIPNESVDYIYTDPPYGKKIPYLDLSVMWNAWLDLKVTEEDYQQEAIEGGEHDKSKDEYNNLIAKSIKEMYRVLKFDRWMSFVFAHKDPEFWHLIIETAESCGFEYVGAVPQKNGQTSFKKRQHPFTVLSGQLIINFRKIRNPRAIMKAHLGMDISEIVMQTIEGIIAKNSGATLEQINDELIIKGLELGFLDLLKKNYSDLTPILIDNFDYNETTEQFTIRNDAKFKTHIDVRLRIRYYLISFLRRMERESKTVTFNDIVFSILPLLKNGTTPENQTILRVLEDTGEHIGNDQWRLKKGGQQSLFLV